MHLPFSPIAGHYLPGSSHYQLILNFVWKYCQNFAEKIQVTSEPFESLENFFWRAREIKSPRRSPLRVRQRVRTWDSKKKIPSLKYISSYERFVGSPALEPGRERPAMGENGKYTKIRVEKRMCRLWLILFYELMTRSKSEASELSIFWNLLRSLRSLLQMCLFTVAGKILWFFLLLNLCNCRDSPLCLQWISIF